MAWYQYHDLWEAVIYFLDAEVLLAEMVTAASHSLSGDLRPVAAPLDAADRLQYCRYSN